MSTFMKRQMATISAKSEGEKKAAPILFDEKTDGASTRDTYALAALTFNGRECAAIFALVRKALAPAENSWRTLSKGLLLCRELVLFGAEAAVDQALTLASEIEALTRYNSATARGRFHSLQGGGRDEGEPVRARATELSEWLRSADRIRAERLSARPPDDKLIPLGADDYAPPAAAPAAGGA